MKNGLLVCSLQRIPTITNIKNGKQCEKLCCRNINSNGKIANNRFNLEKNRSVKMYIKNTDLNSNTLTNIKTDVTIDSIINLSNYILNEETTLVTFLSILSCSICNDVVLNTAKIDTSKDIRNTEIEIYIRKGIVLFRIGLFTNLIGGLLYTQPFKWFVFLKYVLATSLGLAIVSNARYYVLKCIERRMCFARNSIMMYLLRFTNNMLGNLQYMCIIKLLAM